MTLENRHIPALDNFPLAATIYQPDNGQIRQQAVVVINSATAVPRRFYQPFAHFLTQAGFTAVTYDYRGTGDSRPASLKGFSAAMRDWGELDMAGIIHWVRQTYPDYQLFHVGHSVGGQVAGLLTNHNQIDAMVTMSAQNGYWGIQPASEKYRAWLFVHLVFPTISHLFGYFPWSRFASGEDLPKGVALEWAAWCRHPRYLFDDTTLTSLRNFPHFKAPILAYSASDDRWGTARSVDEMMRGYTGTQVERRHLSPESMGMSKIGHFGYFAPHAQPIWQEVVSWFKQHQLHYQPH